MGHVSRVSLQVRSRRRRLRAASGWRATWGPRPRQPGLSLGCEGQSSPGRARRGRQAPSGLCGPRPESEYCSRAEGCRPCSVEAALTCWVQAGGAPGGRASALCAHTLILMSPRNPPSASDPGRAWGWSPPALRRFSPCRRPEMEGSHSVPAWSSCQGLVRRKVRLRPRLPPSALTATRARPGPCRRLCGAAWQQAAWDHGAGPGPRPGLSWPPMSSALCLAGGPTQTSCAPGGLAVDEDTHTLCQNHF